MDFIGIIIAIGLIIAGMAIWKIIVRNADTYFLFYRKDLFKNIGIIAAIIIIIISITIPIFTSYYREKEYIATVTDKTVQNEYGGSKYIVFTKLENGKTRVFSIEDTAVKGRWNSSDYYADIEIGETYRFTVIGWRIPLVSEYENILTAQKYD